MGYSRDFGRIFRNMDYWIELKRLLFKLFRITKFRTRSDKSIRSSNIIKIKELASHFARCGPTDRSVAIQILTLLMWQNFNTKRGTQRKKPVGMETLNIHFLLTVYILYKRTKFPSNIVFTSQSRRYIDVGSTYAIDQQINHLHNDRVVNMWRNNVPSVCDRG